MRAVHFEKIEGLGHEKQKYEEVIDDSKNILTQEYPDDMKKIGSIIVNNGMLTIKQ